MSKLSNAKKRFRQGRITRKQLQSIANKEREEILANMKTIVDRVQARQKEEEHHTALTKEETEALDNSGLGTDITPIANPHIHSADCDHGSENDPSPTEQE